MQLIREIYSNRELIWALAIKELEVRYKRSFLGFLWVLLNPQLTDGSPHHGVFHINASDHTRLPNLFIAHWRSSRRKMGARLYKKAMEEINHSEGFTGAEIDSAS
jgi:hypothetical protein